LQLSKAIFTTAAKREQKIISHRKKNSLGYESYDVKTCNIIIVHIITAQFIK